MTDHYIPLLYLAGVDLACPGAADGTLGAAALPDGVPPDGANI